MGMRMIPMPKKNVEAELAELTKKIASVVNIYDCMDVPLQLHEEPEYYGLSRKQEKAIEDNYDPMPIVRYTLQHEIENGVLLGNEFKSSETFESDKHDRILDLVAENPKIAIICRYNDQIKLLWTLLIARGYAPFVINGSIKNRDEVCLKAEAAKEAIVLIQADCSMGYQLPSFGLCVFASMSYSYVNWEQMCGRFLRMDKPSRTTFMYLVTEGESVDQGVYDAVKRKEDFKIALFKR
jgi:superfamily II DNA or RNA helicase